MSLIDHCAAFLAESVAAARPLAFYGYAEAGNWEFERHGWLGPLLEHAATHEMPWKIEDCRGDIVQKGDGKAEVIES